MKTIITLLIIIAAQVITFSPTCHAESLFKTKISGQIDHLTTGIAPSARVSFPTAFGKYELVLKRTDAARFYADDEDKTEMLQLFQGIILKRKYQGKEFTGASASIDGSLLTINLTNRRKNYFIQLNADLNEIRDDHALKARVSFSPGLKDLACTEVAKIDSDAVKTENSTLKRSRDSIISISLDGDNDFYRKFFNKKKSVSKNVRSAKNYIRASLNSSEAIYNNQLGIKYKVNEIQIDSGKIRPFTSRDSENLLAQFRSYYIRTKYLKSAELFHLFTGKNLKEGVVGLAYVGVLCRNDIGNFSFSLTQKTSSSIQSLITAHEIGHNLGANHLDGPNSLMSPFLNASKTTFSSESLSTIDSYLREFGDCI